MVAARRTVATLGLRIRGDIVVAGNLVEDILVRPVERIEYGFTVWVESIEQHLAGMERIPPIRWRRWVFRSIAGRGGDGTILAIGCWRGCAARGVNIEEVERMPFPTATTVVLVAPDGSRSFLHAPGVSREVFSEPGEFPDGPGHFHLANIFPCRICAARGGDAGAGGRGGMDHFARHRA